jgi:hypothetical protein
LLDRGGVPSAVQGFVTTCAGADLQPVPGGQIAADNLIVTGGAEARAQLASLDIIDAIYWGTGGA